jgi:dTMP kinase
VSVEGIEASGKSTLLGGLAARLRERGIDVVATREPGGTALGDRLRAAFVDPALALDPIAEALLVNASRAQLVTEVIAPALRAGAWVLADRYVTATLAYQGYGRGVDLGLLRTLAAAATRGVESELVFLVDIPTELSRERVAARARASGVVADRLEREGAAFHERVRAGYLALAGLDPSVVKLDGTAPEAAVLDEAWQAVGSRFALE